MNKKEPFFFLGEQGLSRGTVVPTSGPTSLYLAPSLCVLFGAEGFGHMKPVPYSHEGPFSLQALGFRKFRVEVVKGLNFGVQGLMRAYGLGLRVVDRLPKVTASFLS